MTPPAGVRVSAAGALGAIVAGGALFAWWPIVVALRASQPVQLTVLLAHVTGMVAGYLIVVMVALMSRAPALERGVGADVLTRWHRHGGRLVLVLALTHASAAVLAWAQSRRQGLAPAMWQVLHLPWLGAATVGTLVLVGVAVASVRAARRRLSYERWHALHLVTYAAIALFFVHELAGPDLAGQRWLQLSWAMLHTCVFALVLRHRVLAPVRQASRHRLRVAAVVPEGPDVVSILVEGEHLRELDARPGQFFRWRFLTPDTWRTAHPFSLSAPADDSRLRLSVKALGVGSARLQHVPVGTWVEIGRAS